MTRTAEINTVVRMLQSSAGITRSDKASNVLVIFAIKWTTWLY